MGDIKKVEIRKKNKIKWHIQKEKSLKLEEIKEERIIKLLLQQCIPVLIVQPLYCTTESVKNVDITEANKLLQQKQTYNFQLFCSFIALMIELQFRQ